jgi:excisionase family DNA binding protein
MNADALAELRPLALSVEEAALVLGLGRTVTFRLIRSGQLRSFTVGRRRLVPMAACEQYIAERMAQAS